jgi:hypothetical protein
MPAHLHDLRVSYILFRMQEHKRNNYIRMRSSMASLFETIRRIETDH